MYCHPGHVMMSWLLQQPSTTGCKVLLSLPFLSLSCVLLLMFCQLLHSMECLHEYIWLSLKFSSGLDQSSCCLQAYSLPLYFIYISSLYNRYFLKRKALYSFTSLSLGILFLPLPCCSPLSCFVMSFAKSFQHVKAPEN